MRMSDLKHKKYRIKQISSMRELEFMKERYRYEVKLKEQSLSAEFLYFKNDLKSAARQSFKNILEKILIAVALRLMQK
jgi:hypothetical protein